MSDHVVTVWNIPFLDLPITNVVVMSWIAMAVIILFAFLSTRKLKLVPTGVQNVVELIVETINNFAENMIGKEVLVMIEGKVADENAYVGRTYKDAPNVDGLIFVNTDAELMSGDFAKVKVTGACEYDLIGELM